MRRRFFLRFIGTSMLQVSGAVAFANGGRKTVLDIPMELAGDWRKSAPSDASVVIDRMRNACLSGLNLRSDRQPGRLRVEDQLSGPPHMWLQGGDPEMAWIVVDVGTRDWCNLAYQFGHELGHVVANSWTVAAKPGGQCQWLEEGLAEAFSIRGLKKLAKSWKLDPPFPNNNDYSKSIVEHRDKLLQPDWKLAQEQLAAGGLGDWFQSNRDFLEANGSVEASRPAVPTILALYEKDSRLVEDLVALKRWRERANLSMAQYLSRWHSSCRELGTSGDMPRLLQRIFL